MKSTGMTITAANAGDAASRSAGDEPAGQLSTCNVAAHLPHMAAEVPDQPAVIVPGAGGGRGRRSYDRISFAELEAMSNRIANGLSEAGIDRGTRTLVMVRPGFEFIGVVFALFKMGAVPVMIDPGMGVGRMLDCIRTVDLQAFIGIPIAQAMRVLRPSFFASVKQTVTVGRRWFWKGPTLEWLTNRASNRFQMVATAPDETAAILFTSGATGPAKGVVYEHAQFNAQVRLIREQYRIQPGEVDLPGLPIFALFNPALGMTTVIPDMDPSRPAKVDPARIVAAIEDHGVTNTFGSPAIWKRVAAYCCDREIKLPSLRRILIAGAPVPYQVIEQLHRIIHPAADVHTPYGATEALPVSTIAGREIMASTSMNSRSGTGTCVGKPLSEIDVRFIRISDDPIAEWSDELEVPDGQSGEIVVRGPVVTRGYYGLPRATRLSRIRDGNDMWHRMGDIGYRDAQGRIWFFGRKNHRVTTRDGTMFSVPCEAFFNEHAAVHRSALVGFGARGNQIPVIIVEPRSARLPRGQAAQALRNELLRLAEVPELTRPIRHVLFKRNFPVDVRHNAKIDREALAIWAERQLK